MTQLKTCGTEGYFYLFFFLLCTKIRCFSITHSGLVCFRCACRPGNGFAHLQHAGGTGVCPNLRLPHHLQGCIRGRRSRHEGRQRVRGELILMPENSVSLDKRQRWGNCHFFPEGKVSTCPEPSMCCASNLSGPSSSSPPHGDNTDGLSRWQADSNLMGRRKGVLREPPRGLNLRSPCFWLKYWSFWGIFNLLY